MNKTAEQLEKDVCASEGFFRAMTSSVMKVNFVFIATIIIVSYYFSYKALKTLIHQNVFSNCTRVIFFVCCINSMAHQTTMLEIRVRHIIRSIVSANDPCAIKFRSSECIVELYFYYITNYFSTYSVFSMTVDRYLAQNFPAFYANHQKSIPSVLLSIQFLLALGTHLYGFFGVPYAGYVPMCTYPPQLATNFDFINNFRTIIMSASIVFTLMLLYFSVKKENMMQHKNFNTNVRYRAYENMTTSKSICLLIILQFLWIMISSFGITVIRRFQTTIPEDIYHEVVPFMPGVTYANFCFPLVIYFTTKRTIKLRKKAISTMTEYKDENPMKRLSESWM